MDYSMKLTRRITGVFKQGPIYFCLMGLVIILALYFRFYNYTDRLSIHTDNGRDAQIAKFALDNLIIPQIGPFSQAPFFFGPWWYWFLALTYLLPLGVFSPWFVMSIMSLIFLILIYVLARQIGDKWLAQLAFLIAAFSSSAISNYFNIWNPAIIPILVTFSLITFIKIVKDKVSNRTVFLLSFTIALSTTIHFQTFLLAPMIILAIFNMKNKFRSALSAILGFTIPFLPFLVFDIAHNWFWTRSFLIFTLVDQNSIYVPNRWYTYLSDYWPGTWANALGTSKNFAVFSIATVVTVIVLKAKEIMKNKALFLLIIIFLFDILVLRYYKGTRQIYYGFYSYPFIIIFTAWAIREVAKVSRTVAIVIVLVLLTFTYKQSANALLSNKISVTKINNLKNQIYTNYPNYSYNIYGCSKNISSISQPLALFMYQDGRNSMDGFKIGVCENIDEFSWAPLSDIEANSNTWFSKSTEIVYRDNLEWWKKNPPQKSDFINFLIKKLSPKCYPKCS